MRPHLEGEQWPILLRTLSAAGLFFLLMLFGQTIMFKGAGFNRPLRHISMAKVNVLLLAALYLLFLITIEGYFDRYNIPLFAAVALLLLSDKIIFSVRTSGVALMLLFLSALFSIKFTHDYLSWNRAWWHALNALMVNYQVSTADIDGGFEFDAGMKTRNTLSGKPGTSAGGLCRMMIV